MEASAGLHFAQLVPAGGGDLDSSANGFGRVLTHMQKKPVTRCLGVIAQQGGCGVEVGEQKIEIAI